MARAIKSDMDTCLEVATYHHTSFEIGWHYDHYRTNEKEQLAHQWPLLTFTVL